MTELVHVDCFNYDIDKFDIEPSSVKPHKFTDEKTGKEQQYFDGDLTYDGKPPFFLLEGDTYGVQKGDDNRKKKDDKAPIALPQMVQLPSAAGTQQDGGEGKKEKSQIAIKLTAAPAQKDWTEPESKMIGFIDNDLRRILAHVLSKRIDILTKVGSNVISDAQDKFRAEMMTDAAKYPTQELQMARFQQIIRDTLYSKISRKVYRKKKDQANGSAPVSFNPMDSASQYDETKHPTLYAGIQTFISKQTKKEECFTSFYKFVDGVPETEWPRLTYEEASALGWYRVRAGVRFDKVYFGASISPQVKAAEVVMLTPISSGMGHKGRLILAGPEVKRDARLVTRTAIQPPSVQNSNARQEQASTPPQPMTQPMAFDPSALASVPGIGGLPAPTVVVNYSGAQ